MGVVYKAQDTRLERLVALKFLSPDASQDAHALERFRIEARAASALNHPNICTIFDIDECPYGTFIAMELLEGESLRARLRRTAFSPARLLKLAIQLADALEAAHVQGIVHRDIKPENLFVTPGDRLKVLDFGLAKLQSARRVLDESQMTTHTADTPLTQLGVVLGTSAYMSPEQARAEDVDCRSDLFSFGAVLFEMASRRRAFAGANAAEIHAALLTHTPVLPASRDPHFRAALQGILNKALEKNRDFRYQHASDLGADLRRLERDLAAERGATARPLPPTSQPSPAPLARRIAGDLTKAAALTGAVLLMYGFFDGRASGRYLNQFQIALVQESLEHGALDESDFEAGGRHLPLVLDISALHPDKRQPTERGLLDALIDRLRKHGAKAIGIDLAFDDLQATDFQYFHKWESHKNVRVGVYRRAVERREAWLGRPEFSPLAAGIALPPDNPQHAFAYSRRWFPSAPASGDVTAAHDCTEPPVDTRCKEDLIQLPVALWMLSERQGVSAEEPGANEELEGRLRKLLDTRQPRSSDRLAGNAIEFGIYVTDYSYLKELRRDILKLPPGDGLGGIGNVASYLDAHSSSIADRVVLVGDLEDTSDQFCQTQGMRPLSGVLVHACSLATLNRGTLLEPTVTLHRSIAWGLSLMLILIIVGLRVSHTVSARLCAWPYQQLEIIVFAGLSVMVILVCRALAGTSGVVWPNFLWVAGGLAVYPFAGPFAWAFITAPNVMRAVLWPFDRRVRGG